VFPLNLPNTLTVLRILLVPVVVVALLDETPNGDAIAAGVFAVTGLRLVAAERGVVIQASWLGKAKTILQVAAIICLIAVDPAPLGVDLLVYAAVAATVISGVDYFFGFRRRLTRQGEAQADRA
jgi:CDP-diacylglycerol--glycerol-3-phosphate 3-phosphatidyltransferase